MKQLEVQIMGQSYLLGCPPDGNARLLDAVNRVDIAMCKIRDGGKIKARDRIAVLAALNLAFEIPEASAVSTAAPIAAPTVNTTPAPEDAQLAVLLQRLNAALGQDGRLL
jgi:cell division protein ZapA